MDFRPSRGLHESRARLRGGVTSMRFAAHRRALITIGALALILAGTIPAAADCASELTASQQNLERTRAAVATSSAAPDAQKCAAHRRYYAALVKVREVFSRCDSGAQKGSHAAQLTATIDDFKAKMPRGCRAQVPAFRPP
jgi:hypothetical protein